ncbi:hypothetical protein [Salarchaeum japonicum]|uniref:hypothetical protein n=1 Tax=Salarchaeum japonicum TaxID=555573 RepID=UPI003C7110D6
MDSHSPSIARTAGNHALPSGIQTLVCAKFGTTGPKFDWQPAGRHDASQSSRPRYHRTAPGHGHHP